MDGSHSRVTRRHPEASVMGGTRLPWEAHTPLVRIRLTHGGPPTEYRCFGTIFRPRIWTGVTAASPEGTRKPQLWGALGFLGRHTHSPLVRIRLTHGGPPMECRCFGTIFRPRIWTGVTAASSEGTRKPQLRGALGFLGRHTHVQFSHAPFGSVKLVWETELILQILAYIFSKIGG